MAQKDFLCLADWTKEELEKMLDLADSVKANPHHYTEALKGKTLGMIFQKSSTRTRVSFEVGMFELGGHALFLSGRDIQLGRGETIEDTARVLSRYCSLLMARVFAHEDVANLGKFGRIPVINGLSDLLHPCQVMADLMTIREKKEKLEGLKLCYVGDGNNVAHSLLYGCARFDMDCTIVTPAGYEPQGDVIERARSMTSAKLLVTNDISEGASGADILYTDVWASMGQEDEREKRLRLFDGYQINEALMQKAKDDAIFMHCLPAHRGEEVSAEVIDSPQSVVFDEAENRLHAQKAIMMTLLDETANPRAD